MEAIPTQTQVWNIEPDRRPRHYANDDGHQNQNRQRGADKAKLLSNHGENQVRVPCGNRAGSRLCLCARGDTPVPRSRRRR